MVYSVSTIDKQSDVRCKIYRPDRGVDEVICALVIEIETTERERREKTEGRRQRLKKCKWNLSCQREATC